MASRQALVSQHGIHGDDQQDGYGYSAWHVKNDARVVVALVAVKEHTTVDRFVLCPS